ncbi:DUF6328 family protein [Williamsia sp. MIQD14]|uniref:DUF6328 family protein n=1 Tax=Williamsia sp. MIQD14 TaxID=3425703 RepID=UPI003DA19009
MNDDAWNENVRGETPIERLDRNWSSLLQELRVIQTGVQFLTGFLLTLPFQSRFASIDDRDTTIYLVTLFASVLATVLLVAPVAMHRILFRRHAIDRLVRAGNRLAMGGFLLLGVAIVGAVTLIVDVVVTSTAGATAGVVLAVVLGTAWLATPLYMRRRAGAVSSDPDDRYSRKS